MHATVSKSTSNGENMQGNVAETKTAVFHETPQHIPLWADTAVPAIQFSLKINSPGDKYEQEADRVAEQVMRMPEPAVQRKSCSCGRPAGPDGLCEECKRKQLGIQRKAVGKGGQTAVQPIVHQVLLQPGWPLDNSTRNFMEARFGRDFSEVRIHTSPKAAKAADSLQARAFTTNNNIVFGYGQYTPHATIEGKKLLAHELTHVIQQTQLSGSPGTAGIQRACLPDAACAIPKTQVVRAGSAKKFGEDVNKQAEPKREEKRKQTPQAARSGLHSHRAAAIEQLFQIHLPKLRPLVHGVFVDETLPPDAAAMRTDCHKWAGDTLPPGTVVPEFSNAIHGCVFVPAQLEKEAAQYNAIATPTAELKEWLNWNILRVLTHETTHERFLSAKITFPETNNCTAAAAAHEISELAAVISEFPIVNRLSEESQNIWFNHHLQDPSKITGESISGSIKDIRCSCECLEADKLIRSAFELASASWSEDQKLSFHAQMKRGKGKKFNVHWPYDASRIGQVGRHEISLSGGLGFSGADKLKVGMLTYRYVLWNWAHGRLRLTGGLQLNPAALFQSDQGGEFGALTGGFRFISKPVSKTAGFGGLTGRLETGLGVGEFSLRPAESLGQQTATSKDWVLDVGIGIQFYIPQFTSLRPVSVEAGYRYTQPIGPDAQRIQTASLSLVFPI